MFAILIRKNCAIHGCPSGPKHIVVDSDKQRCEDRAQGKLDELMTIDIRSILPIHQDSYTDGNSWTYEFVEATCAL